MAPLANPKKELLAQNLASNKFNKTQAVIDTYPNSSYDNANKNANQYLVNTGVVERAKEIIANDPELCLENQLNKLKDDLEAEKAVIIKGGIEYVRDNSNILDARKFLISKVIGVGGDQSKPGSITFNDNRSINNIDTGIAEALSRVVSRIESLAGKSGGSEQSGEINSEVSD